MWLKVAEIPQWAVNEFLVVFGVLIGAFGVGYIAKSIISGQKYSGIYQARMAEIEVQEQLRVRMMRGIPLSEPWDKDLVKKIETGQFPVDVSKPGVLDVATGTDPLKAATDLLKKSEVKGKEKAETGA